MIDDFRGEYRWLSNFHVCDIKYEGIVYPSTEHAYQAAKTLNPKYRELVQVQSRPTYAKRLGMLLPLREDWEDVKLQVMYDVTLSKYYAYEGLWLKLYATKGQELIEGNNWGDTFWGVCNGVGENHLGKTIMKVRDYLEIIIMMGTD